MTTSRLVPAFVLAATVMVPAMAQKTDTAEMEIFRQKIKADKKLVVAQNLKLTKAEGAAFWPVYDAYQHDLQAIYQRLAETIVAYAHAYIEGPVANETAKKLLEESLEIDAAEAKLRTAIVPKVLAVLPATKAARYIQIENKIRAAVRYELAARIPLVE